MPTATAVQRRRDTATNAAAFTGAAGEIVVDTTNNRMIVHDGATVGGFPAAKLADVGGGTAWTAYTPAIASSLGTFTSASASGRYKVIGKTCFFTAVLTVTTNGTAAGYINLGLPFTAANALSQAVAGKDAYQGIILSPIIFANVNVVSINSAAGAYPAINGSALVISGSYEIA